MNTISYHRAGVDDIETLANLRIEFLIGLLGEQSPEAIKNVKQHLMNYFQSAFADNSTVFYVAKNNSQIVGVGGAVFRIQPGNFKNPSGKVAYVLNMYTVPSFRRMGICRTILDMLVKDANRAGIHAFELHATKEGEPVYAQNGFYMHHEPTYRKYTT